MNPGRTVVDQRFELIEPLGSGGMGTVWRAYDVALHREVALKEVRDDPQDRQQRERVLREARALARIGHPNVVAIHHIVDSPAEKHPWIVMELVRGGSLSDLLAGGPLSPQRTARIGRGVLAALRAAHTVGVLHRDVKPANVLLREDGSPVLTDFGIAAVHGQTGLTSTGSVVGSLEYVAPERLNGIEGHPASDLWSLGLVLFVAVEGYQPMRRETSVTTLAAVIKGEVPQARRAGPLAPVLNALLVPDPNLRPGIDDLDRMLAQVAESAAPVDTGPSYSAGAGRDSAGFGSPTTRADSHSPGFAPSPSAPDGFRSAAPSRSRGVWIAAGLVSVACVGVIVAALVLRPTASAPGESLGGPGTPSVLGGTVLAPVPGPPVAATTVAAAKVDLHSPDGMRTAVAALEKVSGGEQFTETTIYPTYLNTGAPVPGQPKLYDEFTFRDGKAARTGPGGQLSDPTIALRSIDWSVLPGLFAAADQQLGIPKPTNRYVIVDPAWTFNDNRPTLRVYLADDYGGAYLAANLDGSVVHVYPRK
ncbi:serine/threonine-protein kinase [Nocardia sp. NPDC003482]